MYACSDGLTIATTGTAVSTVQLELIKTEARQKYLRVARLIGATGLIIFRETQLDGG